MKQTLYLLSLLGLSIVSAPFSASAQCVASDVSVQANISGSKEPASQRSDIQTDVDGSCTGTSIHTGGAQIRTGGTSPGEQTRRVTHKIRGSSNSSGVDGTTVILRSNPTIDVYNAADRF